MKSKFLLVNTDLRPSYGPIQPTLVGLESLRSLKWACQTLGVSGSQVEPNFSRNAARLFACAKPLKRQFAACFKGNTSKGDGGVPHKYFRGSRADGNAQVNPRKGRLLQESQERKK